MKAKIVKAKIVKKIETHWMLLCIAGVLSASPNNDVTEISGYISSVSFQIVRPTF